MKRFLFLTILMSLMLSSFTASAVTNVLWKVEQENGGFTSGTSFSLLSRCGKRCKNIWMVGAPSHNIDSVRIDISNSTQLSDVDWYYWDSDYNRWFLESDSQALPTVQGVWDYVYTGYEDENLDNDVIGPGTCPGQDMHRAMKVLYTYPGGDRWQRRYSANAWIC